MKTNRWLSKFYKFW